MSAQPQTQAAEPFYQTTDLGNMKLFIRHFGEKMRYVPSWGWLVWDGRRWRRDDTGAVWRLAKLLPAAWYDEAARASGAGLKAAAESYARWANTTASVGKLTAAVKLAESDLAVVARSSQFDQDPLLLNTPNGTLHLASGMLMSHQQVDMLTKLTGVPYEQVDAAPRWQAFLARVLPDPALRAYVQRAVGYSLTGLTNEHAFFLLHGTGANGKSTFLSVLAYIFGDYACFMRPETIMLRNGEGIPNDVAALQGARLVITTETEDGQRLAESLVKRLTGGDPAVARFLHQEFFTFQPSFKLWIAANHLPAVRGTDYAMWRRIHLVPFTQTIPVEERDPALGDRLKGEAAGILAWAMAGCASWQEQGLAAPAAVLVATQRYRSDQDRVGAFMEECCVLAPDARVAKSALFGAYQEWCKQNGERSLSHKRFAQRLLEGGMEEFRGAKGQRFWLGYGLIGEPER